MFEKKWVIVFDVDGVLTDGTFYSTKEGKFIKRFGADDWDIIRELEKYMFVHFVTADKRGFDIAQQRIEEEMGFTLDLVSNKPQQRWNWIKENYSTEKIVYVGDGLYDWLCLKNADMGITTKDALEHTQRAANLVIDRKGGNRFVAEACLWLLRDLFGINPTQLGLNE